VIVANWPDHCPDCNCRAFDVASPAERTLVFADGSRPETKPFVQNLLLFKCRNVACQMLWELELIGADPIVFSDGLRPPIAVAATSIDQAILLTELPETWTPYPLSTLMSRGVLRVKFVTEQCRS
jgi:hypothetical protein